MDERIEDLEKHVSSMQTAYDDNFKRFGTMLDAMAPELSALTRGAQISNENFSTIESALKSLKADDACMKEDIRDMSKEVTGLKNMIGSMKGDLTWRLGVMIAGAAAVFIYLMDAKVTSLLAT